MVTSNSKTSRLRLTHPFLIVGLPLVLLLFIALFAKSTLFPSDSSAMTLAISLDLILTIPIIYFLLIRKTHVPKTTVLPVMILGLVVGLNVLPEQNLFYLNSFKHFILPGIELGVLTLIFFKFRGIRRSFIDKKRHQPDFFSSLIHSCKDLVPKALVYPLATEIAVFYYGFVSWRLTPQSASEFTIHKRTGTPALMYGFLMLIGIETVGLHFLLRHWSHLLAWILTALSLYSAIQIFGFAKSLGQRFVHLDADRLALRYGILGETEIKLSEIDSIELSRVRIEKGSQIIKLSALGELESHNVILRLKTEHRLTGLYGFSKPYSAIAFHVDEVDRFAENINKHRTCEA